MQLAKRNLTPEQKARILELYREGLKVAVISQRMSMSRNTVASVIHRHKHSKDGEG